MPSDYTSNNVFSKQGLNVTPTTPVDHFNSNQIYNAPRSQSYTSSNISAPNYSSTDGYGLVNAAAAVAEAAGQNTFGDVPALGGNNWGADMVKAPEAWAKGYTGQGVVVAVLDTGVDINHVDLKDNIWTNPNDDTKQGYAGDIHGWNFVNNNNNVMDVDGHGTHVSGTIAAENNSYGVTGIAYNAKIMPVKVLDDTGSGSDDTITKGIYYAVDHGANIINMSLGGGGPDQSMENALQYASSKNVIVVMAAGNDGGSAPIYPAQYAENTGIAVGAVDQNKNLASFSNRAGTNQLPYVTAPGVGIYSTVPNNGYATYSGTSMATPHVTGVIALMLSANHNLSDSQIQQILADTSSNSGQSSNPNPNSNPNLGFNFGDIFSGFSNLPFLNQSESKSPTNSQKFVGFGLGTDQNNLTSIGNTGNTITTSKDVIFGLDTNPISDRNLSYAYADTTKLPNSDMLVNSSVSQYWSQNQNDFTSMSVKDLSPENIFERYGQILLAPYEDLISFLPNSNPSTPNQ